MSKKQFGTLLLLLCVGAALVGSTHGCGTEIGNPTGKTPGGGKTTVQVASDTVAAAELVALQIEETLQGGGVSQDEPEAPALAFGLDDSHTRSCASQADGLILERSVAWEGRKAARQPPGALWTVLGQAQRSARLWSDTGQGVECHPTRHTPLLRWRLFSVLHQKFSDKKQFERSLLNGAGKRLKKREIRVESAKEWVLSQQPKTLFSGETLQGAALTLWGTQDQTLVVENEKGEQKQITAQVRISQDDPLVSWTARKPDAVDPSVTLRVRHMAGTVKTLQGEPGKESELVTTYQDFWSTWTPNAEGGFPYSCQYPQGKISGQVNFHKSLSREPLLYSVVFEDSEATVTFSSGEEATFDASCGRSDDFDRVNP